LSALEVSKDHPEFPTATVCAVLGVPRSSFYRSRQPVKVEEPVLVQDVERIVLDFRGYGSRRVADQLCKEGKRCGRRRVRRLMKEHSLLCQVKRKWVRTTDSGHGQRRYPNLAKGLATTGVNQIWHSDITYIRLPRGFCYLATVLDAHSRKVVGWHLSKNIDANLALAALNSAISGRNPEEGWIHHSDQGVQYACRGYVEAVLAKGGRPSMSSKASPYDNAKAESFFASLKKEEVHQEEYACFEQAKEAIANYIDGYYNPKRAHSKIGYDSPDNFENKLKSLEEITAA